MLKYIRLFAVTLGLMIIFPLAVKAGRVGNVIVEEINVYNSSYEYYKMDSGVLTSIGASSENYNIRMDKTNNTLYLNDFNSTKKIESDLDDLNIISIGNNTINCSSENAIYSSKNLTFAGTGSLNIVGNINGIKAEHDIEITAGTYDIHGTRYNGIEAYHINITGGVVFASGKYDGIHTQRSFESEESEMDAFSITGGNLILKPCELGGSINSNNKNYVNSIVIIDDGTDSTFNIYGNATLLHVLPVENISPLKTPNFIPSEAILTIPEDIELEIEQINDLTLNGNIIINGEMLIRGTNVFSINTAGITNGSVLLTKKIASLNEEIGLEVTPANGYKLKSLKYINDNTNEKQEVINNKITMPNSSITIEAIFESTNPQTFDNIMISIVLGVISLLVIVGISIYIKKNKLRN